MRDPVVQMVGNVIKPQMGLLFQLRLGESAKNQTVATVDCLTPPPHTGCIKEFSGVENYIKYAMKTTNPIGKFVSQWASRVDGLIGFGR